MFVMLLLEVPGTSKEKELEDHQTHQIAFPFLRLQRCLAPLGCTTCLHPPVTTQARTLQRFSHSIEPFLLVPIDV